MWFEAKGHYFSPPQENPGVITLVQSPAVRIDHQRPLVAGDTVTIFQRRSLLGRTTAEARITIVDGDTRKLTLHGDMTPENSPVSVGIPGEFGHMVARDTLGTRQDTWAISGNKFHGVVWVDANGQRQKPRYITARRTFYPGDNDPEAIAVFDALDAMRKTDEVPAAGSVFLPFGIGT